MAIWKKIMFWSWKFALSQNIFVLSVSAAVFKEIDTKFYFWSTFRIYEKH